MLEKTRRFFTPAEALEAVRIAFLQYPSQLNLLKLIWPMVFGGSAYLLTDNPGHGIWAKRPGRKKPFLADEAALKQDIIDQLADVPPDTEQLAGICAHVFGAPVQAGRGEGADDAKGIWIETDMGGFVCLRCGHCCRRLDYRDGCTLADYRRWQALGRKDILAWVGTVKRHGVVVACRIWMTPGTNRYTDTCPWLKTDDGAGSATCLIHDVRPMVCRHYPGSRKHARLTGCRGV